MPILHADQDAVRDKLPLARVIVFADVVMGQRRMLSGPLVSGGRPSRRRRMKSRTSWLVRFPTLFASVIVIDRRHRVSDDDRLQVRCHRHSPPGGMVNGRLRQRRLRLRRVRPDRMRLRPCPICIGNSSGRLFVPRFSIPGPRPPDLRDHRNWMMSEPTAFMVGSTLMLVSALIASIVLAVRSVCFRIGPVDRSEDVQRNFSGIVGDSMLMIAGIAMVALSGTRRLSIGSSTRHTARKDARVGSRQKVLELDVFNRAVDRPRRDRRRLDFTNVPACVPDNQGPGIVSVSPSPVRPGPSGGQPWRRARGASPFRSSDRLKSCTVSSAPGSAATPIGAGDATVLETGS